MQAEQMALVDMYLTNETKLYQDWYATLQAVPPDPDTLPFGVKESLEAAIDITILTASGERLPAHLERSFPKEDLAVLKVDTSPAQCLPLGTVSSVNGMDRVLGLGYPVGDRADNQQLGFYPGTIFKFRKDGKIETDAVRGEGQSSGPVYHGASRCVVGVVSQGYLPERVVFAGLAIRLEPLFAAWPALNFLPEEVAQT